MNRLLFLFSTFIICISGCDDHSEQTIYGTWQVDSVCNYYNGFVLWDYNEGLDWADYELTEDGVMKEYKFGTYRKYTFELNGDTIKWVSTHDASEGFFEILERGPDHMALKRVKTPIFQGRNQERYEIRFFSKGPSLLSGDLYQSQQ